MAVALFALLMMSFASVQSAVMQASMASGGDMMSICGDVNPPAARSIAVADAVLQRSVAPSTNDHGPGAPHHHEPACPFCAVAGHTPVLAYVPPIRPSTVCAFIAFHLPASQRPLALAFQTRARGPPVSPLTT